ncbi:DUF4303 domain-containing protein [Streptomyces tendae]|uniref:DUF4303 domain-containing protein n=1 Tax=Streptomyces tendae TaxID=1932 RepID=UPI0036B85E80
MSSGFPSLVHPVRPPPEAHRAAHRVRTGRRRPPGGPARPVPRTPRPPVLLLHVGDLRGGPRARAVRPLFAARGDLVDLPDDEADADFELRLCAMETAVARPDAEGLFGTGADRHSVVVTVEVPSEEGDEERTPRLNPPEPLANWAPERGGEVV